MFRLVLNHPIHKPGSRQVRSLYPRDLSYRLQDGMNEFCLIANSGCIFTILACRLKYHCASRFHHAADSLESSPKSPFKNT